MLRTLSSYRAPELGLVRSAGFPACGVRATFESPVFGPPDWRVGPGVWTFSGLKARDMTAWGEAQRAKPQVRVRKENPLRAESAGHWVEMIAVFCFGLSGLGGIWNTGYLGLHSLRSLQPRL